MYVGLSFDVVWLDVSEILPRSAYRFHAYSKPSQLASRAGRAQRDSTLPHATHRRAAPAATRCGLLWHLIGRSARPPRALLNAAVRRPLSAHRSLRQLY